MKVTHPHFRVQFPESFLGQKHRAGLGHVFLSSPEIGEIELPQVLDIELGGESKGGWEITIKFIASAEVQYIGEES